MSHVHDAASSEGRALVAGATGALGGVVARKLLAAGFSVRALGRNREKLAALSELGADTVTVDLLDAGAVSEACAGVGQLFASANNVMGSGASSPLRVDVAAYRNLCAAAVTHGVRRIVHVSGLGLGGESSPVDYFRVKHQVDGIVQGCGVPWVLLRPSAFLETWAATLLGDGIRDSGVAVLFGDGTRRSNFIAIDDVADVAVRIMQRQEICDEIIELGGPSNMSYADLATLIERELGITAKRRHIPVPVMRVGSLLLRPLSEVTARKMALGYFAATRDATFPEWKRTADRFGVSPMTAEQFIARWAGRRAPPAGELSR